MFKQCEPKSLLSHCFWVDLIFELLVVVSQDSPAGRCGTQVVLAAGYTRQSYCFMVCWRKTRWKEQKQGSCGACEYKLLPKHRCDCCPRRENQCSHWSDWFNSNLWLTKMWDFFLDMLYKWLWFSFFHLELHLVSQNLSEGTQVEACWRDYHKLGKSSWKDNFRVLVWNRNCCGKARID